MKDVVEMFGTTVKNVYKQTPFYDQEKKLQRLKEKIQLLKQQENEVYAEIGRHVYQDDGAQRYPQEREKLDTLYQARRTLECEVEDLEGKKEEKPCVCSQCGKNNEANLRYCRHCGEAFGKKDMQACSHCGKDNPIDSGYCGYCGTATEYPSQNTEAASL